MSENGGWCLQIGEMLTSKWTELYFQKLVKTSPPIGMNQAMNNHGAITYMKADMSQWSPFILSLEFLLKFGCGKRL